MSRSSLARALSQAAVVNCEDWEFYRDEYRTLARTAAAPGLQDRLCAELPFFSSFALASGTGVAELSNFWPSLLPALEVIESTDYSLSDHAPLSPLRVLDVSQVASLLEMLGAELDGATLDKIRDLLGRIETSTYEMPRHPFRHGLLGLIYDVPSAWQAAAGVGWSAGMPFEAGRTFGFNLPALVGYFGLAVTHGAAPDQVRLAYEQFLAGFTDAQAAEFVTQEELLLVGRVFYGVVGGHPVGEILDLLVDELWRGRG